jgi:Ni,Fe-hydrogenase III large subunit
MISRSLTRRLEELEARTAPEAVQGNIIADFPVINKSFNLSYSGTDR